MNHTNVSAAVRFQQLRLREAAGFGLGLSISHVIVLAHSGELSLHDRQPHGLIVRVQLPVRQQIRQSAA